nr:phage antirepressor N-terminal domain-containing protein [Brucella anthropi]
MNAIVKVDFYGDTVLAQRDKETVLVAVKPIIDRLGLDWEGQRQRIRRDEILNRSACVIKVETPAGSRDAISLPLGLLPGFLFGISTERIADPDMRAAVIRYKEECYSVLYQHFYGRKDERLRDWDDVAGKLMMVKQARLAFGAKAAQSLWNRLGLPPVSPDGNRTETTFDETLAAYLAEFLDECTVKDRASMMRASDLYRLYQRWAIARRVPVLTLTRFGMLMRRTGLAKHKGRHTLYLGLRASSGTLRA